METMDIGAAVWTAAAEVPAEWYSSDVVMKLWWNRVARRGRVRETVEDSAAVVAFPDGDDRRKSRICGMKNGGRADMAQRDRDCQGLRMTALVEGERANSGCCGFVPDAVRDEFVRTWRRFFRMAGDHEVGQ